MKDMIKRIREEREGFTLAELLIVVAIIAVLVAIAIPVFNSQLEKSREATDLANIRAAYAEVTVEGLENDTAIATKMVNLTQKTDGWQSDEMKNAKIGEVSMSDKSPKANGTATVTYNPATTGQGATAANVTITFSN